MKKKFIYTVLFILFSFLILREVIPFDLNWYSSENKHSFIINDNSRSISTSSDHNIEGYNHYYVDLDKIEDVPIVFFGLDDVYETYPEEDERIDINVNKSISLDGNKYIPFFKNIDFNSQVTIQWSATLHKGENCISIGGSHNAMISGTKKIKGLCSAKKVTEEINKLIVEIIREKSTELINRKLNSIRQSS